MIKPGYSLVVVAPPRGTLTNFDLEQGLVARLTPYSYPFYSPSTPTPSAWRPAIQLDSELN